MGLLTQIDQRDILCHMMLRSVINAQGKEEEGRKFLVIVLDSQTSITHTEALHEVDGK